MSWFTQAMTRLLPFAVDAFETRDLKQSGDKLFRGLAAKLKEAANDPEQVREIAAVIEEKAGELTGAIVARTPAAGLLDAEWMPPGSIDPNQEQVAIPTGPTGPATGPTGTAAVKAEEEDEEYEYDDHEEDDEPEDEQNDKPKTTTKKKKKK